MNTIKDDNEKFSKMEINSLYKRKNNVIFFGSYPQEKVTDENLICILNEKAKTLPTNKNNYAWTDYNYHINQKIESYMWYIDIEHDNNKYRGIYFTKFRPMFTDCESGFLGSHQKENEYFEKTVY